MAVINNSLVRAPKISYKWRRSLNAKRNVAAMLQDDEKGKIQFQENAIL